MNTETDNFIVTQFSTDAFPERDRAAMWREVLGRKIIRFDAESLPHAAVKVEMKLWAMPGLKMNSGVISPMVYRRTPEIIAGDADGDDFAFGVNVTCPLIASHAQRETTFALGEGFLMSCGEKGTFTFPDAGRFFGLRFPRGALAPLVSGVEDALMRRIPPATPALRLLRTYLRSLEPDELRVPELRAAIVAHVHQLLALAVGPTLDGFELINARGLRVARTRSILAEINAGFADPAFSAAAVAIKLGISVRYLQELLHDSGGSFAERVLELRLRHARRMLADRRNEHLKVNEIALACGFNEVSYFHRCFRRRYGATPAQLRGDAE
ncbi:MAG TPA: AraC family transcriptional regulator [Xanthobacteraceae bacterium]|nr:AraC family transcriptional regulator [Xanthobacteraceae bacterium]